MLNVYIYSPPHPFDGTARNNKEKESNGHDDAAVAQKNMDRHMAVNPNVKEKGHGTLDQPASDMSSTARAAEEHLDKFMLSVTDADILLTAQKDQKGWWARTIDLAWIWKCAD